MSSRTDAVPWLSASEEPWTRYRALVDLEGRPDSDPDVVRARSDLLRHPLVSGLVTHASEWPGYPLKRHNDAAHPLYAIATLADFGVWRDDPGVESITERIMDHFDGAQFETLLSLPRFLTKEPDTEAWAWMLCDAPTLLYGLLAFGCADDDRVQRATAALAAAAEDNGWRCGASDALPSFSGPGRKADTCPMATTYALKALSLTPHLDDEAVVGPGIEAILSHWEHQTDDKLRMFGIGTEFRKLRYPFVWYDILHVTEVLSRYPHAAADPRLAEMVDVITAQSDEDDRHTASAMFRAWNDWSFADKKRPSAWLTFLVHRIQSRLS